MAKCYASDLIKVAEKEVGYLEKASNKNLSSKTANAGSGNYTKYADYFDKEYPTFYNGKKNGYAWCDVFVDWCFVQAFGKEKGKELLCQPAKSAGAGCLYSMNYYKNKGQFYTKDPKKGDQIFFYNSSKTDIAHTGLVYKVDDKYVYTIEGNTSAKSGVVANGGAVEIKSYSLTYYRIAGYGRPKYDKESEAPKTETKKTEVKKPVETKKIKVATNGGVLNCRKSASVLGKVVGTFKNGTTLTIISDKNKSWYEVKGVASNGKTITGFVNKKWVKKI